MFDHWNHQCQGIEVTVEKTIDALFFTVMP
jgi:hypothetical protein